MPAAETQEVYCLHGLMGTCLAHCGHQVRAWRQSRRVVPFDLPGHGRSKLDAPPAYFTACAELVRARLLRHGAGHLVGVSYLGGTIALRVALDHPELVRSVVVTGFAVDIPAPVFRGWIEGFVKLADQQPLLRDHYAQLHGDRWRSTLAIVATDCEQRYASAVAVTRAMITALRVPTLVVNGSSKSDERFTAAALPSCNPLVDAAVIPAAGHIACHDQPEIFNLIVEGFWEKVAHG